MTVTSDLASVTSVGSYCWRADYTGDASVGVPPSSDSTSTECFSVTPVTPTLSTLASGGGNLPTTISDTATLIGTANEPGMPVINPMTAGSPAKGTITFTVFHGTNCTTPVFGPTTVTVNGDATYSAGPFTPTAVGTYTFVATYSGDSPNTTVPLTTATCAIPGPNEAVIVTDTTSVTTAQNWLPNDSATISSTGGTPLSGTVTFTLYNNGTCDPGTVNGNVLYTEPTQTVSGGTSQTVITHNTSVTVSATTTVSWKAVYTSTAANVSSSNSRCEITSLTITN